MKVDLYLQTNDGHELAIYTRGNSKNPSVIFLHGGPGGSINEKSFSFFDLNKWYVIAFDQRGCGNSKPFASLHNNTIKHSASDIELIRQYFNLNKITVFGGSYGSTLALYYAIEHPEKIESLVLRGIFLGRNEDVSWLYQEGASYFYPEEHNKFKEFIKKDKQGNLVNAYYQIFTSNDEENKMKACKIWSDWESSVVNLVQKKEFIKEEITKRDISIALLECYYFENKMFWNDDNYILNKVDKIKDIPIYTVHGRYDVDCRLSGAYQLHEKLNNGILYTAERSGHSPYEEESFRLLKNIMKDLES
ncbi:Prolyl aminopeptidase [Alteracholeplasma palmae J233]|uniref:Proline iminopeptidase n=1 Tax=Alteracholeplasma palmae (strain ATCC 49389 / J233) TaxID=1318466 RepID=U4KL20_ALTPJ|nr:prolyl aminopeptidase [Alteracholeplasma palmae]CCV64432.1 Prolyl aminopeptidase [Alteracholeplasma palmae J233]